MRLRRETGDFRLNVSDGSITIRKGLSAEDLIGNIVEDDGVFTVIVTATQSEGTISCVAANNVSYTYNVEAGTFGPTGD